MKKRSPEYDSKQDMCPAPSAEQVLMFPEIKKDLKEAAENGDTEESVFKKWAGNSPPKEILGAKSEKDVMTTPAWKLLKERYNEYREKKQ